MRRFFSLFLLTVTALPCFAADSSWDGTWKLNASKSQMTGTTTTFTQQGSMYHLVTGPIAFDFACDGKTYPVFADRTMTCVQKGNAYTTQHMAGGKLLATTVHTISADGKTITETTKGTRPDGTSYTSTSTSQREGSGQGLVGTWRETAVKLNAPSLLRLRLEGNKLRVEDPNYKSASESALDGTPAALTGPTVAPGTMISTTAEGPSKVLMTLSMDGKDMGKDEMTLSADGKTLTDVSWTPGKEDEKLTYTYDKQ